MLDIMIHDPVRTADLRALRPTDDAALDIADYLRGEGDDEGGEGWAVCMAPVNEWLAVSRRQVAAVREAVTAAGL